MTKTIYCTKCKTQTEHEASVERGDIIFTCTAASCDRFVKFPASLSASELQDAVAAHQLANTGIQYLETEQQAIEAGLMTQQQIDDALAAIASI